LIASDPIRKIRIRERTQRVSGLSLSSLKAKKAHQEKQSENLDESNLPHVPFTEEELKKHWADFVKKLDADGRKILASNLSTDLPRLGENSTIFLELPNGTMKKEIEREQGELLTYLRKNLNNFGIQLKITINEESAKRFAFTPAEKYEKLREKNPAIDLLRREFDLEL
jgi:DNA polymerase-3 subunit gamma/tau